jgi:hypothetical protein
MMPKGRMIIRTNFEVAVVLWKELMRPVLKFYHRICLFGLKREQNPLDRIVTFI